jgi:hypothetical protein
MFLAVGGWDDRVRFTSAYNVDSTPLTYSIDPYFGKPELVGCSKPRTVISYPDLDGEYTNLIVSLLGSQFPRKLGENLQIGWNLQRAADFCLVCRKLPLSHDSNSVSLDERLSGSQVLSIVRADQTKSSPKSGALQLEWNNRGDLLLVRFGAMNLHVTICYAQYSPPRKCSNSDFHISFPIPATGICTSITKCVTT